MQFDWVETIGFAGTGLTIVAYGMRRLIPLRIAGILSSVAFLVYGLLIHSYPFVLMELTLLPINLYRLLELLTTPGAPVPQRQRSRDLYWPARTEAKARATLHARTASAQRSSLDSAHPERMLN